MGPLEASNGSLAHVNGAVDPIDDERARLDAELAAARARLFAAKHAEAEIDARTKQALREELSASRARLAELEAVHAADVDALRRRARDEAEAIVADARRRAEEIEAAVDSDDVGPPIGLR
jgi:septal ring factor EnvC (AmiA/AmiB activator)